MKTLARSLIAISLISFASIAESADDPVTTLSFEEFREACVNPAKFHNQVAPKNIQVSCQDAQTKWIPDSNGSADMGTRRVVSTAVTSDKYSAVTVTGDVVSAVQTIACPQFKQVTEMVDLIQAISCEDLVASTGNSIDFCVNAINALRASNPEAIKTNPTGVTMNYCTGVSHR